MAASAPHGERSAGRPHAPLPAGNRRAQARRGLPHLRRDRFRSSCRASSSPSFATLSLGVVLGPEAPLIAIGSGLGVLALHFLKKDAPDTAVLVIGAAGSFAAVSALLGLAARRRVSAHGSRRHRRPADGRGAHPWPSRRGVGTLIFIGLDSWTGYGTQSLAIPDIPPFTTPTVAEFLWAIGIGLAAAVLGSRSGGSAILLQPIVERRMVLLTPIVGFGDRRSCAVLFAQFSDHDSSEVLFSGQDALPGADRRRRRLDRRRAHPAHALQGPRLHPGAEQFPRRSDVPGNVHRRRRRHRAFAPPRPPHDRRRRHGHRRPVRQRCSACPSPRCSSRCSFSAPTASP